MQETFTLVQRKSAPSAGEFIPQKENKLSAFYGVSKLRLNSKITDIIVGDYLHGN
jgi:hypothetical protein